MHERKPLYGVTGSA